MNHFEELNALDPRNTSYVPSRIETPTPHKFAVLMLVQQYLKAKQAAADVGVSYPARSRQRFCMLLLKLIQYPDMTYRDLHTLLTTPRYKIDSGHMEGFEKAMADLTSKGIENLFDFAELENIEKMLSESIGVSQFSIVGLYIRRVGVILERMSFPEMMALYKNICLYYEKGLLTLAMGSKKAAASDSTLDRGADSPDVCMTQEITAETIEEKKGGTYNTGMEESVLDTEIVHQDRNVHSKWSAKQADLFVTQQCSLLENNELRALPPIELQTKVAEIIKDNPLHSQAYFLGYMNQLRLRDFFSAMDALHRSFDRSPMQMMTHYEQKGFQYFSVNLAVLHANFNHRKEAKESLRECIMLAQECGDKRCLDLANSWYYILNSNTMDPFEKSLPDLQDPGLIQSFSLAVQFIVKFGAQRGYMPIDLFELLMKSDELNCKSSIMEHFSDSLALRSSLWCLYGRHEQSSLYAQLLLKLKKTWVFGDVGNSESVCKVICSLALWLSVQGELTMSAAVLQHARERFPRYPFASNWMICQCHITVQQAIYRCRWQAALKACCQLYILDRNASILQRASVYIAKRYLHKARHMIKRLLDSKDIDCLTQVRALMLLAYTMISADSVKSEAISVLLKASRIAQATYMEYESAITDMIFAHVLLNMQLPQKALEALKNSMDKILTNGGIYDRARADFVFVRCLVATGKDSAQKLEYLSESLDILARAEKFFKKLEAHAKVLDVYTYLARTFDEIGDRDERNKYACKFKQYHTEHPIPREYLGVIF